MIIQDAENLKGVPKKKLEHVFESKIETLTLRYTGYKMLQFTRGWAIMAHPC